MKPKQKPQNATKQNILPQPYAALFMIIEVSSSPSAHSAGFQRKTPKPLTYLSLHSQESSSSPY